jgi:putative PIN family toxin of toxin-antitoxin system
VRILLDTNVFISGVFFGGLPYQILKLWRDGRVRLVLSPEILDEYQRVGEHLAEQFPGVDVDPILELLTLQAELISAAKMPEPVCVDPDDDKFLPCALTAKIKLNYQRRQALIEGIRLPRHTSYAASQICG